MDYDDDKDQTLHELSLRHGASIVSQLVDIGNQGNQLRHIKYRSFVSRLQCLQLGGIKLRRTFINAFRKQEYVALSYTWTPSEYEDPEAGRYRVEVWDGNHLEPSIVRNCVFDRILGYMRYTNVQLLWIDAHCIPRDASDDPASTCHTRCTQKRDAIQAMDLVYQLSKHPVALLGRPLRVESELHLLARILLGDFVDDSMHRLSRATTIYEARKALWLLCEITRDSWWGRAWTFQENYRGGQRMKLLIRHDPSLEQQKLRLKVFDKMPGELCMLSISFSTEATRLCLALNAVAGKLQPGDLCRIDGVLRAAGRYALLLPESSAMTPTVMTDIEARGLEKPWDRLAILANCCQYSVRLDDEALRRQSRSLSLSMLAMCLLNGEILNNNNDCLNATASLTTSKLFRRQVFEAFNAPEDDTRRFTFNKGCRLTDVELTAEGVSTKGHLWKLSRIIDTSKFYPKLPWINEPRGRLTLNQRKRLLQLALHLFQLDHFALAHRIKQYLADDAKAGEGYATFTEMYLHRMAIELAAAVRARRKLRLGSIWDPKRRSSPYRAIFVWSTTEEDGDGVCPPPAFVFTSARSRDPGSEAHEANDIDRHVSLEVDLEEPLDCDGMPHLRIRTWRLGICFFEGCPRTNVVFPWPRALRAIKPL